MPDHFDTLAVHLIRCRDHANAVWCRLAVKGCLLRSSCREPTVRRAAAMGNRVVPEQSRAEQMFQIEPRRHRRFLQSIPALLSVFTAVVALPPSTMINRARSDSTTPVQSDSERTSDGRTSMPSTLVGSSSATSLHSEDEMTKAVEEHIFSHDLPIYPYQEASPLRTLVDILRKTISTQPEALAIDPRRNLHRGSIFSW